MPRPRPHSACPTARRGLTLVEVLLAFAVLVLLLAILIPSMHRARIAAWRDQSHANLGRLHRVWDVWLAQHDGAFPYVPAQPGWRWGGVRHSAVTGRPFLDTDRPLSQVAAPTPARPEWFRAPADAGIRGPAPGVGTGARTCFEAFGTSYRANPVLLDARLNLGPGRTADEELHRGLRQAEIDTAPDRLVLLGEPLWAEVLRGTGLDADWYGEGDRAALLFLDGSVRSEEIVPGSVAAGAPIFEPSLRWVVRAVPEADSDR